MGEPLSLCLRLPWAWQVQLHTSGDVSGRVSGVTRGVYLGVSQGIYESGQVGLAPLHRCLVCLLPGLAWRWGGDFSTPVKVLLGTGKLAVPSSLEWLTFQFA